MKKFKCILTSVLTIVMCFSVLSITTKASVDYNVKTLSFTHGSVSISSGFGEDISGTLGGTQSADIYNYLSFNFDKYYSGTVTLKFTYSSSAWRQNLTDWNILVIGGKIDSNNNSSGNIVFRVYDKDSFMVVMTHNTGTLINGTDPTFSFSSASSSLTAVANHNSQYDNIADIETELVSANTQLGGIVSLLGALQTLQTTISNNINNLVTLQTDGITNTDIETKLNLLTSYDSAISSTISGIYGQLTTVLSNQSDANSLLNDIENNTDGIETLLATIEGTLVVNGVSSIGQIAATQAAILSALSTQGGETLYDLVTDIVDQFTDPNNGIIAELTALNALVTTTNQKLDEIKTTLTNIYNSINSIDNQIDIISWNAIQNATFYYSSSPTANQTLWMTDSISTNVYQTLYFYIPKSGYYDNKIYKIRALIYGHGNLIQMKYEPYGYVVGANIYERDFNLYSQYSRNEVCMYIYPDTNVVMNSDSVFVVIKVTAISGNIRYSKSSTNNYFSIDDDDIEYWQLLEYFNQFKYQQRMLDLININVDSETSLTIYNNDNEIIDTINDGFGNEYSVFRPIINQQLAPLNDSTLLNEFSNQRTLFDYLFRNLFNIDPAVEDPSTVTNPIFLILIFGGILLALVG